MHLLTLLPLLAPALALPTSLTPLDSPAALDPRQSCYVKCGNTCYTSAQVSSARTAAYNYVKQGSTAGSSTYPHKYNNYEGFDFLVGGTYFEFPLKTSGVYTGGSPGADRVVVNGSGARAGEITHTGASGNNFVACSGW
ncbi:Ribonuclease T(1) [Ascochyta lentis]